MYTVIVTGRKINRCKTPIRKIAAIFTVSKQLTNVIIATFCLEQFMVVNLTQLRDNTIGRTDDTMRRHVDRARVFF